MPLLTCLQDSSEKIRGKRQKVEGGGKVFLFTSGYKARQPGEGKVREKNGT